MNSGAVAGAGEGPATKILADLIGRGVAVWAEGQRFRWGGQPGCFTDADRAAVDQYRPAVITALVQSASRIERQLAQLALVEAFEGRAAILVRDGEMAPVEAGYCEPARGSR